MSHYKIRIEAVNEWLRSRGQSTQQQIARRFEVQVRTLQRWIKLYRNGRLAELKVRYWKRFDPRVEQEIYRMKEKMPWLTIGEAQQILGRSGINCSVKGIWSVWRRHGLARLKSERFSIEFIGYRDVPKHLRSTLAQIYDLLKAGDVKQAAVRLNQIPICPEITILSSIPDQYLSLPRRIEKLFTLKKTTPRTLLQTAKRLRKEAEQEGLRYSAIRVGVFEATILSWFGQLDRLLKLIKHLKRLIQIKPQGRLKIDPPIRFSIYLLEGVGLAGKMQTRKALRCARRCQVITRQYPDAVELHDNLAGLFSSIGYFREALGHLKKVDLKSNLNAVFRMGIMLGVAGRYRSALSYFRVIQSRLPEESRYQLEQARAQCYIGLGQVDRAVRLIRSSLEYVRGQGISYYLHTGTLFHAACYAANRDKENSLKLIRSVIPIMKRMGKWRDLYVRFIILGQIPEVRLNEADMTPPIRLAMFLFRAQRSLNRQDYWRAYRFAISRGIVSHLHILLLFYPEPVRQLMKRGEDPRLPGPFLDLPIFRTEIPVFHLKILGQMQVYRNGKLIRDRISPKAKALLIHLALRSGTVLLSDIYKNFWPRSRRPERNLSQLLVSLRRFLRLTSRELFYSLRSDRLIFQSPLTTDYQIFYETTSRARMLEGVREWTDAKQEYLRAFRMVRGRPFLKMYDRWSDEADLAICNRLESVVKEFVNGCIQHKSRRDARRILKKILKITPHSEYLKKLAVDLAIKV